MARILFIGIDYYQYARAIKQELERAGHSVDFHPIQKIDFFRKASRVLFPRAYRKALDRYHARIIEGASGIPYDVVLFIQVHHLSRANMDRLREQQQQARFILYNWDPLCTHDYRPMIGFFDKVVTFDFDDSRRLGIGYLPLFAVDEFFAVRKAARPSFDVYSVGMITTIDRYRALRAFYDHCRKTGITVKFHLFCSPPTMARLLFRGCWLPGMTLRTVGFDRIVALIERSTAVVDFANYVQSGYTMRLIENLAAGIKIVTNNRRVLTEDFYSDDRFLVVEDGDFGPLADFLKKPVRDRGNFERFSVRDWIRHLLD